MVKGSLRVPVCHCCHKNKEDWLMRLEIVAPYISQMYPTDFFQYPGNTTKTCDREQVPVLEDAVYGESNRIFSFYFLLFISRFCKKESNIQYLIMS